mmetsp:Transcript_5039/g.9698  ORF Transcript_5039/g.9698 Transcript_5039/m.9698 type:complete len:93 (+) Transcript_5039:76-354(+)
MSTNDLRFATAQDRHSFIYGKVRPLLEDLALAYYSTSPPPEDIVAFLVNALRRQHGLPEPPSGGLPEQEAEEAEELAKRVAQLREEIQSFGA